MGMPLTVKQYKIREYLATVLTEQTETEDVFDDFLKAISVELPTGKGRDTEVDSWADAVQRVRNKLLS